MKYNEVVHFWSHVSWRSSSELSSSSIYWNYLTNSCRVAISYISNSLSMSLAARSNPGWLTSGSTGFTGCYGSPGWPGSSGWSESSSSSGSSGSSLSPMLNSMGFYKLVFCISCCYLRSWSLLTGSSGLGLIYSKFSSTGSPTIRYLGIGKDLELILVLTRVLTKSIYSSISIMSLSRVCCLMLNIFIFLV